MRRRVGRPEQTGPRMEFRHGEVQGNITPQQVDLVKQSFAKVLPIRDDAAALFYQRLFEIASDVKTLFPNDMVEQGRKLMTMLGTVVNGLHDLDAIVPAAQQLAVRHVDYGVRPEHYAPVGEALIWTLEQGLQDAFDAPTRDAWLTAYTVLSTTMIDAAYA